MPEIAAIPEQYSAEGIERAAVVLLALGPEASAEVLKQMTDSEVDVISHAMVRLGKVNSEQAERALRDFHADLAAASGAMDGNLESVRSILTEAFGQDRASRLVDRLSKSLDQDVADFDNLRRVDPQQLAKFIQDEHPQTIALILSHLDSSQAAALLAALPAEVRLEVITRMAALDRISPESVRVIATVVRQKLRNLGELSREVCGGVRAVADLFNRMDATNCNQLLEDLQQADSELFESVRRFMFVFEDLLVLDDLAIKELLAQVDRKVLLMALKASSDQLRKHLTRGLSQRGADMLNEDLNSLGPIKIKDADQAQQTIIQQARQLEQAGVISLRGAGTEQYIK